LNMLAFSPTSCFYYLLWTHKSFYFFIKTPPVAFICLLWTHISFFNKHHHLNKIH
jgi:hypothetical protein